MCSNVKSFEVGLLVHPAVMFMNFNKLESNLRRIIKENCMKCSVAGIALMNETIVNKGPNRDIDRDAVNMLITQLITGQYDTVVVENMSDITGDESDLEEFMYDAANIGVVASSGSVRSASVNCRREACGCPAAFAACFASFFAFLRRVFAL